MSARVLFWNPKTTPKELHSLLETLGEAYPLRREPTEDALTLEFSPAPHAGDSVVAREGNTVKISYGGTAAAARAVGSALAGLEGAEHSEFTTLGIMLDCSRNAVMKVDYLKKWLRALALLGYNRAMLYTEDTYELPGEPYFGYMRGAYTEDELTELDAYAARLGIELIGCIQTLGHLEQILRWPAYGKVRDTGSVLLVDEDATYELIEKMVAACARAFKSRTLHIGMDETHDLGRGRFMDLHGCERGFELFNRHLARVVKICEKHGLRPMIWSDMYFRMSNPELDYYCRDSEIPPDVKKAIPSGVDLVYWDYYHRDADFYREWIRRHRELGGEPLFGSGIWSWSQLWYNHEITVATVAPGLEAAREAKLAHVFFTMWGDDGAFCEFDSILAGLVYAADLSWGGRGDEDDCQAWLAAVAGMNYRSAIAFTALENPLGDDSIPGHTFLFDDPLMGMHYVDASAARPGWVKDALAVYDRLAAWPTGRADEPLRHAQKLAQTLAAKLRFRRDLEQAYFQGDKRALGALADHAAPKMIRLYQELLASFRKQWMRRNKPFGFELTSTRLAGVIARYRETALRIEEYLAGDLPAIDELEESKKMRPGVARSGTYTVRGVMSGSTIG